jgi:hypothetical protein
VTDSSLSSREGTAALQALAEALNPEQFAATIVPGVSPHLRVTNRHARQLTENVYAGQGWFWWSWAERITGNEDPHAAAAQISRVLQTVPEPAK